MSAELLRRAAALMRERAEAAIADSDGHREWVVGSDGFSVWTVVDGKREYDIAQGIADRDAEHIASWHPDVTLAVADWLERIAVQHGPIIECGNSGCRGRGLSGMHCDDPCEQAHEDCLEWRDALAVARIYLGEPA